MAAARGPPSSTSGVAPECAPRGSRGAASASWRSTSPAGCFAAWPSGLDRFRRFALTVVQADFNEPLPFRDRGFDAVVCLAGLHLAGDLERLLSEAGRVLRPGGLFVSLPIRGVPATRRARHPVALGFWLVRRLPGWRRRARIGPMSEFTRSLGRAGLEALRCEASGVHIMVLARRCSEQRS